MSVALLYRSQRCLSLRPTEEIKKTFHRRFVLPTSVGGAHFISRMLGTILDPSPAFPENVTIS